MVMSGKVATDLSFTELKQIAALLDRVQLLW